MAKRADNGILRAALSAAGANRLTDRELLTRFAEGDETAFAAIVKRHSRMVFNVCRRVLPTVQDAEDACQAVFLVLARKAKTGQWQSSIANWLYMTARRSASMVNRSAARRMKRDTHRAPPAPVSALDEMTGREAFAALDEELGNLPATYREPLVLCYLQGLTRSEAALRLGVPAATLKSQLDRGRKKLADALSKRGIDLGAALIALAATASAGASSMRLTESILTTVGGTPSAAVAIIAKGVAVNWFSLKAQLTVLAAVALAASGFGLASMPTAAGPQPQAIEKTKQPAPRESMKIPVQPKAEQPVAKKENSPNYPPIDRDTIAAYKKIGGQYVGFFEAHRSFGTTSYTPVKEPMDLPGFRFEFGSLPDGVLPELPPVGVSFGLDLSSTGLTDAGLKQLMDLKNLSMLNLNGTKVTDEGMKGLRDLKSLTKFYCEGNALTDEGVKELKGLENLTSLHLGGRNITDAGLKELKGLKNLTSLRLSTSATDAGLKDFLKDRGNLTSLGLGYSSNVTDAGLEDIKNLKQLTALYLSNTKVTDVCLKEFKDLKLTALNLDYTGVTDAGLKELKDLKTLLLLRLEGDLGVTDAGLKELANLPNLNQLYIPRTGVTAAGLKEFEKAVPRCMVCGTRD